MALKKPSDFFENTKKTPLDEVKEEYIAASPEKIEQVSEAFDTFKANLNHIKSLSDFTSTFDSFRENLEKVENVSSEVDTIKDEIKSLLKQEDLDSAMMAQLLFVEESISKIESKISSINGKTVDQIKEDFKGLSTSVEGFLSIDVPKYKKLISESEVRVDDRFGQLKDRVEENLNTIRVDVNKEVTTALSEVEKLNTEVISEVKEDFRKNTKEVKNLVEKELPKYRKFFTETELKTEETIKNAIDSYKETIENLNAKVKVFTETEIPKYNNLLIETKLKSEQEVKELEEEVLSKVNSLSEKVDFISGEVTEKTAEKIEELQTVIDEYKEEIDSISKTYSNLYKDFKKREISDNEKLEGYSNEIEKYNKRFNFLEETVTEDLKEIQSVLINSNETYHAALKTEVGKFRNNISEQMKGLQMDLVVNEQHIKKQNENIEAVKEEIQEVLKRLQLDTLEEKNKELVEKITYLEETISEINEKKLLVEDNPTLPGDPSTNNSEDPLTPLDQKFVTFDQLQNHYRTFINRIQQQIATIGGGGAGVIHDLDDVTFDRTTGEGKLLIYDGAKWVGIASTALGGGGGDANSASKLVLDVRNNNIGYALTIGTPVYQTAYNSGLDRLDIEESRASNSVTMPAKGVVSEDLANNTSGQIIVYGELEGVNTQAYEVGDELYVAPGGGLTNVRPTDPTHLVQKIAVVLKKSTANGAILVYGAGRTNDVPNNISIAGSITAVDGFFSGNVTVGGTITYEDVKNVDSLGIVTARTGIDVLAGGINAVGVVTATSFVGNITGDLTGNADTATYATLSGVSTYATLSGVSTSVIGGIASVSQLNVTGVSTFSTGIGTVQIGVGNTALLVQGDARVTGILTVGEGSITLNPITKQVTGIDEVIVGSGASVSLAPLFTSTGTFVVDYSKLTLSGYSSAINGTYNRQSTSFVLAYAPTYSGSARFLNYSGYYYFLHESDNSKIIIYNIYDGYWSAVHSSGSNFSSPSYNQQVYPVTYSVFVTPIRASYDNTSRAYPGSGSGIEYSTIVTDHTSSLGIATGSSLDISGVTTATKVHVGVDTGFFSEDLVVNGSARITGIFTVGRSSVTIDGENNTVSVGLVTVTNSTIILGDNVTIDASASGINSAPNVLYVAKDGSDSNNGTSIDNAFLTIAGAVGAATSGTIVKVLSGNYVESNPIEIPAFVGVVGDDQRTVKVLPSNTTQDIFHVNKGCKIANMTFSGHLAPAAAVAFPSGGATNVGGGKWKGPYIQNCTSDTTTGTGIYIDGDKAVKTKSMNVDAFTQYNQGGVGVAVTNEGYAQLVSVFTICCNEAITVHKGGQADLANSNCSFGTYGLVADGVSPEQFTGSVGIATGGGTSTDYSEVTLSSLSSSFPQSFNQTYTRQSAGFVLNTAPAYSGSARIHADSNYYYYVSSTGSNNTSRALIFSEVDNRWVTIFTYSINFTSIYDGQPIGSVYTDNVTTSTTTADGRNVPTASSNIVYATSSSPVVGTGTAVAGQDNVIVNVGAVTTRPYDGQVVYFDKLYKSVDTITITSGGSGYTSTPSVTISSPTGPNGEVATAFATLENGVVTEIDIISSGSQYDPTDTVTVTISAPDSGTTATATANLADTYYTINSSTPITAGITTLTLAENLLNTVGLGSTAYFFQQSKIIASSHTFEYIGSGNDITSATPKRGGVTIQANEVVTQNGGSVIYTSTDQAGNFRIGDEFQINQNTGTISGRAFSKSLFSEMTPFILALS